MALILFIDDEDLTLELLDQAARILGHEALTSSTLENGLALAREKRPDLIVTDINLAGKNSFSLIKTLSTEKETSHIPVLTLSALDPIEVEEKARENGAAASLGKPIRLQTLLEVIREYTAYAK